MSVNSVGGGANSLEMILSKAKSATEGASSMSQNARDLMEAFSPQKVLGGIAEVFKALGSIGKV